MSTRVLGIGLSGTSLTELERKVLTENTPFSVILFSRNVGELDELRELVAEIKSCGTPSPLIAIDQEGGRVDRLRNLIPGVPGASSLGESENPHEVVGRLSDLIGEALRALEIDINFAPVVDVARETPVPGLERRTFGKDPQLVTELAQLFMNGMHRHGVSSCLKHFPGMGAGEGDPHYGSSIIRASSREISETDLVPYRVLGPEAPAVMIGHAIYPSLEGEDLPATLSPEISTTLLRDQLGFDGLAFSDDMEMHAVSDLGTFEEIKERALLAGSDVVFFCSQVERMPELVSDIEQRLREDSRFRERLDQAASRAETYRVNLRDLQERTAGTRRDLDAIRDDFEVFCREFSDTCRQGKVDRRSTPRTPGTGVTGREEWT